MLCHRCTQARRSRSSNDLLIAHAQSSADGLKFPGVCFTLSAMLCTTCKSCSICTWKRNGKMDLEMPVEGRSPVTSPLSLCPETLFQHGVTAHSSGFRCNLQHSYSIKTQHRHGIIKLTAGLTEPSTEPVISAACSASIGWSAWAALDATHIFNFPALS